ncbi:hypothetical protein ACXJJ3_20960 [Kribbella sp. WER1]
MPTYVRYQSPAPDRRGRRVKPTATYLLEPIPGYLEILAAHNLPCERYTSDTPGRILYEDDHQLVVVPPPDPTAPTTLMWLRPKVG